MFSILIHLINIIIVVVYACLYSIIILTIAFILSKKTSINFCKVIIRNRKFWFSILTTSLSIVFLFYHYSYSRDHGFGDSYKIPIGNKYFVTLFDGAEIHFENSKSEGQGDDYYIQNFIIADKTLCAKLYSINSVGCNDCFMIFNTELEKLLTFKSSIEYETYVIENNLPNKETFREFIENYNYHWDKNRRWYLP